MVLSDYLIGLGDIDLKVYYNILYNISGIIIVFRAKQTASVIYNRKY